MPHAPISRSAAVIAPDSQSNMELRHLRYFVAVAEELHFRRAAERLHMSQPPVSQQVRALEAELGVELLRRNQRRVELTPSGAAFLLDAREILAHVEVAVAGARRIAAGELGELRVGFVGSAMYGRVPELLRRFGERRPDVQVRLRELTSTAQVTALQGHHIDIGFLRPPVLAQGVTVEVIEREGVVLAVPADHALARRDSIDLTDLADTSFITLSRADGPGINVALTGAMAAAGAPFRIVQEVSELATAVGLVAAGVGVCVVPASLAALDRHDVAYRPLLGAAPAVELALARRSDDDAPLVAAFLEMARERGA